MFACWLCCFAEGRGRQAQGHTCDCCCRRICHRGTCIAANSLLSSALSSTCAFSQTLTAPEQTGHGRLGWIGRRQSRGYHFFYAPGTQVHILLHRREITASSFDASPLSFFLSLYRMRLGSLARPATQLLKAVAIPSVCKSFQVRLCASCHSLCHKCSQILRLLSYCSGIWQLRIWRYSGYGAYLCREEDDCKVVCLLCDERCCAEIS